MKFEIYKDVSGQYRWRFKASNGQIIADSAEAYTSEQNALNGINIIKNNANGAPVYRYNY